MRKSFLLSFVCLLMALGMFSWALGHECWLAARRFILAKGEALQLSLLVGENFEGEKWQGRIITLTHHQSTQKGYSLLPLLDTVQRSLSYPLKQEGTQLFSMQSAAKYLRLEADKFNAYLEEDGLAEAISYRRTHQQEDSAGTELYERSNKMLVQVGNKRYTNAYKQKIGTLLEIILLNNPYQDPTQVKAQVLFRGKPAAQQLVKYWFKKGKKTMKVEQKTDAQGNVAFACSPEGQYMLSTVKMVLHDNAKEAQWHSYWASFTFGFEE